MTFKDFIARRRNFAAVVLCLVAVAALMLAWPDTPPHVARTWTYHVDSDTLTAVPAGREPEAGAYRAYLFTCAACEADSALIGYLEDGPRISADRGRTWRNAEDPDARRDMQPPACADGAPPRPCYPQ